MFWGLIMEPQKRYSQTVKHAFHVSMAAIDVFSSTEEPVQVMCSFENRKYLLCTLHQTNIKQCALDLNFEVGDKVTFLTNGESHVHLTGYLTDDPLMDGEELEEEELENEDLGNVSPSNIVSGKRQKKISSTELQPPAKKSKTLKLLAEVKDTDDSDDSDVNLSDIIKEEDEDTSAFLEEEDDDDVDESGDDEEGDEEEDGDDAMEEEDDDDDDDSDEDEGSSLSSDEEVEVEQKPKMNGTAKEKKGAKVQPPLSKKEKKQQQAEKNVTTPKGAKGEKKKDAKSPKQEGSPQKKTVEGGVVVEDIKVGNGQLAKPGKMVQVYYEGRFKNNNKMFDSSTKGNGFKFRLGKHEVIKGWDVGVSGMKVGGKRRIVCPPHMAYGAKGSPPTIPPNSTLVFEVELKNVN